MAYHIGTNSFSFNGEKAFNTELNIINRIKKARKRKFEFDVSSDKKEKVYVILSIQYLL